MDDTERIVRALERRINLKDKVASMQKNVNSLERNMSLKGYKRSANGSMKDDYFDAGEDKYSGSTIRTIKRAIASRTVGKEIRHQAKLIRKSFRKEHAQSVHTRLVRRVEVWFRNSNRGQYHRQFFSLSRDMTFGKLTEVALTFWKDIIPPDRSDDGSSGRFHFVLKDSMGAIWPKSGNACNELTNHRRVVSTMPRLILTRVGRTSVQPKTLSIVDASVRDDARTDDFESAGRWKGLQVNADLARIVFYLDIFGMIVFLTFAVVSLLLFNMPSQANYHASRYVERNLVDRSWRTCFDSSPYSVLMKEQSELEAVKICRNTNFYNVTDTYQIFEWARSVWFFHFGKTEIADGTYANSPTVSNYQVVGDTSSNFWATTGSQIIGDVLVWTVRDTSKYGYLSSESSADFGSCSTSSGAVCWVYKSGGFPPASDFSAFGRKYNGDGFVISIPLQTNSTTVWDATVDQMETAGYVDEYTRAIGFTANIWNQNSGLLFSPNMVFEFTNTGAMMTSYRTDLAKTLGSPQTITLYKTLSLLCIISLIAPLLVIVDASVLAFRVKRKKNKESDKTLIHPGYQISSESIRYAYKVFIEPAAVAAVKVLYSYLIFHIAFVAMTVWFIAETIEYSKSMDNINSSIRYSSGYIDTHGTTTAFRKTRVLRAFSILFALLKSMYFLSWNRATRMLMDAVIESFPTLGSTLILMFTVRLAVMCLAVNIYGTRTESYSTLSYAFVSMNFFLLGSPDLGETFFGPNFRFFEACLLLIFIAIEYYTFFALLLVILTYFYKRHKEQYLRREAAVSKVT
eukprot:g1200.t1